MLPAEDRWQGRVALVTGAGRGIGEAIAIGLAERGVRVAVNDLPGSNTLDEVVQRCRSLAGEAWALPFDVSDEDAVGAAVAELDRQTGGIDFVAPNAAYSDRELFYSANMDGFRRTIAVTMWGPFYVLRAAANAMIARGKGGSICVVSSTHAAKPIPGAMAYNMSKAAIEQMVKTAATELVEHRIRVNAVRPGWVNTPGERKFFTEETLAEVGQKLPMGRLQHPSELADGVSMMLDPHHESVNGAVFAVDGGIELPIDQMFRLKQ